MTAETITPGQRPPCALVCQPINQTSRLLALCIIRLRGRVITYLLAWYEVADGRHLGQPCQRRHGGGSAQMQKLSTGKFHFEPYRAWPHSITSSAREERRCHFKAKRLRGVEVDNKLVLGLHPIGCAAGTSSGCARRAERSAPRCVSPPSGYLANRTRNAPAFPIK